MRSIRWLLFIITAIGLSLSWRVTVLAQNPVDIIAEPSFAEQWTECRLKQFESCAIQLLQQEGSLENCQTIHDPPKPYAADGCITMLAGIQKNPDLCAYVEFKDDCYFELAKAMRDPAVCRKTSVVGGMRGSCYSLVVPGWKRNMNILSLGLAVVLAALFIWLIRNTIRSSRFAVVKGFAWGTLVGAFPLTISALGFGEILYAFVFPVFWFSFVAFRTYAFT